MADHTFDATLNATLTPAEEQGRVNAVVTLHAVQADTGLDFVNLGGTWSNVPATLPKLMPPGQAKKMLAFPDFVASLSQRVAQAMTRVGYTPSTGISGAPGKGTHAGKGGKPPAAAPPPGLTQTWGGIDLSGVQALQDLYAQCAAEMVSYGYTASAMFNKKVKQLHPKL